MGKIKCWWCVGRRILWRGMGWVGIALVWNRGTSGSSYPMCIFTLCMIFLCFNCIFAHLIFSILCHCHYSDVIMNAMTSRVTGVSIAFSKVCVGADQRKHQSSASLAFVRGIHLWPVNSPHKGPVTRKMFPFDDVIIHWPQGSQWASFMSIYKMAALKSFHDFIIL